MGEQRNRRRARLDVFVNKYVQGTPYTSRANNISPEGLGLDRVLEPRHKTRKVGLQFQLPGSDEVIYAEGEVVQEWVKAGKREGSGVRFTLLTERHRRLIDSYVATWGEEDISAS